MGSRTAFFLLEHVPPDDTDEQHLKDRAQLYTAQLGPGVILDAAQLGSFAHRRRIYRVINGCPEPLLEAAALAVEPPTSSLTLTQLVQRVEGEQWRPAPVVKPDRPPF